MRSEKEWKVIVKKAMGHAKQGQPVIDGGQAVTGGLIGYSSMLRVGVAYTGRMSLPVAYR